MKAPLQDAAAMNATRWRLYERLRQPVCPSKAGRVAAPKWQEIGAREVTTFGRNGTGKPEHPGSADTKAWLTDVPTFGNTVPDLPRWRPHVVVVMGARTYSAGFDILLTLKDLGAHHVGVPTSQAPTCFIDVLRFTLPHSQFTGIISFKQSPSLPGLNPAVHHLEPEITLTYDPIRTCQFDTVAGVRLALDAIHSGRWEALCVLARKDWRRECPKKCHGVRTAPRGLPVS